MPKYIPNPTWQSQHTAAHATAVAAVESLEFILRTTFLRPMATETLKSVRNWPEYDLVLRGERDGDIVRSAAPAAAPSSLRAA